MVVFLDASFNNLMLNKRTSRQILRAMRLGSCSPKMPGVLDGKKMDISGPWCALLRPYMVIPTVVHIGNSTATALFDEDGAYL